MKFSIRTFVVLSILAASASPVFSRIADPSKREPRELVLEFIDKISMKDDSAPLPKPDSEPFPYISLETHSKCPLGASEGRMFKNTNTASVEECYDRCYGLQSCNYFSYWASEKMCIGCTLKDDTQLLPDSRFAAYKMYTMKSAEDFGYELWNGVEGIGRKCPFVHEDRITKYLDVSKDECFQKCQEEELCDWFSWGEDEVNHPHQGDCMLCSEDDEFQEHKGFNTWTILKDDVPPGPTPTNPPTALPTKETCPGEIKLVQLNGSTACESVSIVSQDTFTVTVKLTQTCTKAESDSYIDFLFWQYQKNDYNDICLGADEVHSGESTTATIVCNHANQHATLKLWVVDDIRKGLMSEGDDVAVPNCCHPGDLPKESAASKAVYSISCVPLC